MIRGYARVSTTGQNLDAQHRALSAAGCEIIHEDRLTGGERSRPGLDTMLTAVEAGDVVVITRLDRLARSTRDLLDIIETLSGKGAAFRSLAEPWADTASPGGKMVMTIFAGIAEFERSLIAERAEAGRAAARSRGVKFGRKPKLTSHQRTVALKRLAEGDGVSAVARDMGVHHSTISRLKSVSE